MSFVTDRIETDEDTLVEYLSSNRQTVFGDDNEYFICLADEGDYIFVNKMAYDFGTEPQVGDIVVFKYPNNPEKEYIKRIVALGGETVQIADKLVYIDDEVEQLPIFAKNTDQRVIPGDLSYRDNFGPTQCSGQYLRDILLSITDYGFSRDLDPQFFQF